MFGLGTGEILIILVLALILLGPQKLPEAAKSIGKGLRQISRATEDVKRQMQVAMYEEDRPKPPTPAAPPAASAPAAPLAEPVPEVAAATAANVPGLEAAFAEPAPQPAIRAEPAPAPPDAPKT
jgi:sec-independent protein translocase protein TatB